MGKEEKVICSPFKIMTPQAEKDYIHPEDTEKGVRLLLHELKVAPRRCSSSVLVIKFVWGRSVVAVQIIDF